MKGEIVTLQQLAELLQMSPSWVRKEVYAGKIPTLKFGRSVRFHLPTVLKALGVPQGEEHSQK